MTQIEFIARQLSKAQNKVFEHYVIQRVWHLLNDLEIKFVTQQYVKRPTGIALTDMYFPQLKMHLEVDEGQHFNKEGQLVITDKIREADIINATGHRVERIPVAVIVDERLFQKSLKEINERIDSVVHLLREIKTGTNDFKAWDFEAEQNPSTYIKQGYIDLKDDVAFPTMVDTVKCFGREYKPNGIWVGGVKHPKEWGKMIWFPQLYYNAKWNNSINHDETVIYEKPALDTKLDVHVQKSLRTADVKRIVFAKVRSPLGDTMYRFKGEYQVCKEQTNLQNGVVFKRIAERVVTYS
jgi:very-short-patch-repair endonuclease